MTKILNSAEILTFDTIRYEINANHKISALSEIKLYVGTLQQILSKEVLKSGKLSF